MTRKRFVKMLMAIGADRNEAQAVAHNLPKGMSYEQHFKKEVPYMCFKKEFNSVLTAIKRTSFSAEEICRASIRLASIVAPPAPIYHMHCDPFD